MFKWIKIFAMAAISFFPPAAGAQYVSGNSLYVAGFEDYPPFGMIENKKFGSVFDFLIQNVAEKNKWNVYYETHKDYDQALARVRQEGDLVLGIYHETERYRDMETVYPALHHNPVKIIMLPRRMGEIKSVDDLRKLKGGVNTSEHFSDHVRKQIAAYKPVEAGSSLALFEKLFSGEIDYIFSGYYFGLMEAIRLGLRNEISFSKQDIWNIPLFIGISPKSKKYGQMRKTLIPVLRSESLASKIEEQIKEAFAEAETRYFGVVAPDFVRTVKEEPKEESSGKIDSFN